MTPTSFPPGGDDYHKQALRETTRHCAALLRTLARLDEQLALLEGQTTLALSPASEPLPDRALVTPALLRALRAQAAAELRDCQAELAGEDGARRN